MTDTTVTGAVARVENSPVARVLDFTNEYAKVLPASLRPETFARLATGALRRDPKLMAAAGNNLAAFLGALLDAARLGLEPGTDEYYLTPRGVKDQAGQWHDEILGIVGYKGEVKRMFNSGMVAAVKCEVVREHDSFSYDPASGERPKHTVDWFGDRGEIVGVYAYAELLTGATSQVVILTLEHIDRAKASSASWQAVQAKRSKSSPWLSDFEAMVRKTCLHRLRKFVPASAEHREQLQRSTIAALEVAERRELPAATVLRADAPEPLDGEIVDSAPEAGPHEVVLDDTGDRCTMPGCSGWLDDERHGPAIGEGASGDG